jgi:serine/threonine protein phosphatase PrpC
LTNQNPQNLSPAGAEIFTQIKTINLPNENVYLCQILLNCHHKQDAVKLIVSPDNSFLGGILCDGVSESPISGVFSKFLVDKIEAKCESILPKNKSDLLTTTQFEHFLNELVQEFYQTYENLIKSQEISPKSTLIFYIYVPDPVVKPDSSHLFFYLGDGKIAHWDNHSSSPPSELLLEYHNETGALLNAVRKDLPSYSKQFPISKITLNLPIIQDQTEYFLLASDGLEPYYEDFLNLLKNHPEIENLIYTQQVERLQSLFLTELFEDLKIVPNDDISFIFILHERK